MAPKCAPQFHHSHLKSVDGPGRQENFLSSYAFLQELRLRERWRELRQLDTSPGWEKVPRRPNLQLLFPQITLLHRLGQIWALLTLPDPEKEHELSLSSALRSLQANIPAAQTPTILLRERYCPWNQKKQNLKASIKMRSLKTLKRRISTRKKTTS